MNSSPASEIPLLRGPVALSHLLARCFVRPGDKAVDATCGNGHDALMLAGLVGPQGHVWCFDLQQAAIVETARRLAEAGLSGRATLLHSGHEQLGRYLAVPVQAVLFNLGYLPGGDRSLVTRPDTTVTALEQSLQLLAPSGVVLVTIYPGHGGGDEERQAVDAWAAALDPRNYHSWRMGQLNVASDAPYCVIVQKTA